MANNGIKKQRGWKNKSDHRDFIASRGRLKHDSYYRTALMNDLWYLALKKKFSRV